MEYHKDYGGSIKVDDVITPHHAPYSMLYGVQCSDSVVVCTP